MWFYRLRKASAKLAKGREARRCTYRVRYKKQKRPSTNGSAHLALRRSTSVKVFFFYTDGLQFSSALSTCLMVTLECQTLLKCLNLAFWNTADVRRCLQSILWIPHLSPCGEKHFYLSLWMLEQMEEEKEFMVWFYNVTRWHFFLCRLYIRWICQVSFHTFVYLLCYTPYGYTWHWFCSCHSSNIFCLSGIHVHPRTFGMKFFSV